MKKGLLFLLAALCVVFGGTLGVVAISRNDQKVEVEKQEAVMASVAAIAINVFFMDVSCLFPGVPRVPARARPG